MSDKPIKLDDVIKALGGGNKGGQTWHQAIESVANNPWFVIPKRPAKHWWAPIAQVAGIGAVIVGLLWYANRVPHIPVHKSGPDRTPTTAVTP